MFHRIEYTICPYPQVVPRPKVPNEELVRKYRSGDEQSLSELLAQNSGLLLKLAGKHCSLNNFEDLYQEGVIALMLAAQSFDPHLGIQFVTLAWHYVETRMRDYVRHEKLICRPSHGHPKKAFKLRSLNALYDRLPDKCRDFVAELINKDECHEVMRWLTSRERDILLRRCQGDKLDNIAKAHGISRRRVQQLLDDAIARAKRHRTGGL